MKKLKLIVLIAVLIEMSPLCILGQTTNVDILIKPYEKLTGDVLKNFKQDHDDLMVMQTSDRRLKTALWLKLLEQISKARDLNFDFKDPNNWVSSNVAPPMDPSNPKMSMYPAGSDPSSIKEPEIRAAFEKAIKENHEKYLRVNFEFQLKRLDEDSTMLAVRYFNSAYAKTPDDAKELLGCLESLADTNHKVQLEGQLREFVNLAKK